VSERERGRERRKNDKNRSKSHSSSLLRSLRRALNRNEIEKIENEMKKKKVDVSENKDLKNYN
jgi:hypothetical protein